MKKTDRPGPTRRQFLTTTAGATAGMASWLALGKAPAFAQKRELTFLSWNHFVPASDDELRKQAEAFGKANNCTVRVDTMAHLQMPSKVAAEAQSQSGHDMYRTASADPFLYENLLVSMDDVVEKVGKQGGGWYSFAAESCQTKSGWKAIPWFWVSFPGTYNMAHFKKAGFEHPPKTWDELLKQGRCSRSRATRSAFPSAIARTRIRRTGRWRGRRAPRCSRRTARLRASSPTRRLQVIEWYKELYKDAMEPEVLSWDDAGNNRFILSGKGSWIHNPVSPYNAALANKQPIADDINHHNSPGGPAGIHSACPNLSMGIWKFSKNQELAKEFIAYLFQKQNFDAWIVASNAFNHPPLKNLADHPIWARNPKFAMLPKEAEYAHPRGWPAKPNEAVQRIDDNYIMTDMVAKAVNGMPPKRAMDWAQEQIVLAVKGQLKVQ